MKEHVKSNLGRNQGKGKAHVDFATESTYVREKNNHCNRAHILDVCMYLYEDICIDISIIFTDDTIKKQGFQKDFHTDSVSNRCLLIYRKDLNFGFCF